jgi:hypothetical protein
MVKIENKTTSRFSKMGAAKSEAYLNEFKGHIFEYLVGSILADRANLTSQFLSSIGKVEQDRLYSYERIVRETDFNLYKSLASLADKTSQVIIENEDLSAVEEVLLSGRQQVQEEQVAESDLIIRRAGQNSSFLSLKFGKQGSFVNTKSGGVKSFLSKYFAPIERSRLDQKKLNLDLDKSFEQMGQKLYFLIGETFEGDFKTWVAKGYSELPGELPKNLHGPLETFYFEQIRNLHAYMTQYFEKDRTMFIESIGPLLGFGHKNLKQAYCFYQKKKGEYTFKESKWLDFKQIKDLDNLKIGELSQGLSSFEIAHPQFTLQIRMKPMNKFTTAAMKINCSVKWS